MDAVSASFDIMSKGMIGSLVVAGIMMVLTIAMTKFFSRVKTI
jgi:hypothetical protein